MRVVWTRMANFKLDAVGDFIAKDNPKAAAKLLKQIRRSVSLLQANPFLGRRTDFIDVRELVVHPNYLISYRVSADIVEILQVWQVAQQRYH